MPRNNRKKIVRGDQVKELIANGIRKLASAAGREYVFNATELSRFTGVSRPTIYSHSELVDKVLEEVKAQRKLTNGEASAVFLREKVEKVKGESLAFRQELDVLRRHHADIYERLYRASVRLVALIAPEYRSMSLRDGSCVLCRQAVDAATMAPQNVISLDANRGHGDR